MIVAVGLSNLQHCDMSSSRNLFVVGLSMFTGLAVPQWISSNQSSIHTGVHSIPVKLNYAVSQSILKRNCEYNLHDFMPLSPLEQCQRHSVIWLSAHL